MTTIRQEDLIQSVADALQFISYFHPVDFIKGLAAAYEKEQSPAARDAIAQLLINSRMCAEGHRPICQDTGIVTVFLKVGMNVQWNASMSVEEMVKSLTPTPGCIVLALLDGEFTIKRYRPGEGRVVLQAENPVFPDIEVTAEQAFEVWGVVTRSIRLLAP